jgi:cyanophycin synthetase
MTSTNGIYINQEMIVSGDCSGPKSAQAVLLHPHVEVAVLETARGGILREGLAFDECLVGVVTNISADHLGLGEVDTLDELARVKQVVVEVVSRDGAAVLNAEDPLWPRWRRPAMAGWSTLAERRSTWTRAAPAPLSPTV